MEMPSSSSKHYFYAISLLHAVIIHGRSILSLEESSSGPEPVFSQARSLQPQNRIQTFENRYTLTIQNLLHAVTIAEKPGDMFSQCWKSLCPTSQLGSPLFTWTASTAHQDLGKVSKCVFRSSMSERDSSHPVHVSRTFQRPPDHTPSSSFTRYSINSLLAEGYCAMHASSCHVSSVIQ